jgi:flagellar hook-associated protein 3 FlgL
MGSRITNGILFRNAIADISRQTQRLFKVQEQASSGLRINHLSDDPVGVRAATLLKAGLESTAQSQRNITQARSRVTDAESSLVETSDVLLEAKLIAIQGRNDTMDATSRVNLAGVVESLHERLMAAANRQSSGGFIFSGYTSDVKPFTQVGSFVAGSPPPTVTFSGDPSEVQTEIDEGVLLRSTLNGERVFMGRANGGVTPDAGRVDLFAVLGNLWEALNTDTKAGVAAVGAAIDELATGLLQVSLERTDIGSIDNQLTKFDSRLSSRKLDLSQRLSDVQDADSVEVFSDLVTQETALRASLQVSARMLQPSLLDFLG